MNHLSPLDSRSLYLRIIILSLFAIFIESNGVQAAKSDMPQAELDILNRVMRSADLYLHKKQTVIDSLKNVYNQLPTNGYEARSRAAILISQTYLPVRADSALTYSELALDYAKQSSNRLEEFNSRIARINALCTAGIFTRAVEELQAAEPQATDRNMKISYWLAGRKLYGYMRMYVEGDKQFFNEYTNKYLQYDDSLINNLPANDPRRIFYVAERLVQHGNNDEARNMLMNLCNSLPEESNLYGMAAFQLGLVCRNEGDPIGYASYLAKAAISDIKGCVTDGYALPALAEWLYRHGELDDAFKYINFALEDAMRGNVRMRTVSIAALLPMIDEAYKESINASRDELMIYFLLVTFLFILSVVLVMVLLRIIKRSRKKTAKLEQTAHLQETYIGHFIGLCSTYATRLDSLRKLVTRKLASGQSDELMRMIKTGKFDDDENEEFYKTFDSAFLDIFPDFIEKINELLRSEERIELKKPGELTPELRIYGFVRLGVDDSPRIAQILNYSVTTVYSYRNRMRARAIDREHFDYDVMMLGKKQGEESLF